MSLRVVFLVQSHARLVENVEHARHAGAHLRRQAHPLELSARKGHRGAIQTQIVKTQLSHHAQPARDLIDNFFADDFSFLGELE